MSNFLDALQNYSGILLLSLLILVIILLICTFNLSLGLSRLNKKYKIFMKGKDGQSLEKLFKRKFDMIEKLASNSEINREDIQKLEKLYNSSLHKYGIVKYDAFEDMGGKLSFVLALLDKENTGFLLNAIHSRENCFLYQYFPLGVRKEEYIFSFSVLISDECEKPEFYQDLYAVLPP